MRVLVDTSVWVDFLNGHPSRESNLLSSLIASDVDICTCGVVVAEVFQGLRQNKGRKDLEKLFRKLIFLESGGFDPHLRAAELYRNLRARGRTVRSTIDCLIAILAEASECYILTRDRDLTAIVSSGLVKARLLEPDAR